MSTPSKLPAGLTLVEDKNFDPFAAFPALPEGLVPAPPPELEEDNYFKQVKDRVTGMAAAMHDAWKKGDIETMTGIPATIGALNKQYYEKLPQSKSTSEFLLNLIPIFGPTLNDAAKKWGEGKPQTSAAELTTDVLLPLFAEKIPGALADLFPAKVQTKTAKAAAQRLYSSALKPPISGKPGAVVKSEQMVTTGLEEGLPVSASGVKNLVNALNVLDPRREKLLVEAGKPKVVLTPKNAQLQSGPVDFELGPTVPPAGTKQTVLSHPRTIITAPSEARTLAEFMEGIKEFQSATPSHPERVAIKLDEAKNAQIIEVLNKQAQDSGLLEAVQSAARRADQPVPYDISEIFNMSVENAIDPNKVAARLDQLKKRFKTTNPEADLAAIDAAKEEFLRNYPDPMSYTKAQGVKTRTYATLKEKAYGEQKGASAEAQKTLVRGIKEELEDAIPELKALNERESKLLGLRPALLRAVQRVKNWEVIGLQTPMAAAAGGAIGHFIPGVGVGEGATAAAIIALALRDPWLKSKLAIAINRAATLNPSKFGVPSITAAEARINAYQAAIERAAIGAFVASTDSESTNP